MIIIMIYLVYYTVTNVELQEIWERPIKRWTRDISLARLKPSMCGIWHGNRQLGRQDDPTLVGGNLQYESSWVYCSLFTGTTTLWK